MKLGSGQGMPVPSLLRIGSCKMRYPGARCSEASEMGEDSCHQPSQEFPDLGTETTFAGKRNEEWTPCLISSHTGWFPRGSVTGLTLPHSQSQDNCCFLSNPLLTFSFVIRHEETVPFWKHPGVLRTIWKNRLCFHLNKLCALPPPPQLWQPRYRSCCLIQ